MPLLSPFAFGVHCLCFAVPFRETPLHNDVNVQCVSACVNVQYIMHSYLTVLLCLYCVTSVSQLDQVMFIVINGEIHIRLVDLGKHALTDRCDALLFSTSRYCYMCSRTHDDTYVFSCV